MLMLICVICVVCRFCTLVSTLCVVLAFFLRVINLHILSPRVTFNAFEVFA